MSTIGRRRVVTAPTRQRSQNPFGVDRDLRQRRLQGCVELILGFRKANEEYCRRFEACERAHIKVEKDLAVDGVGE